MNPNPGVNTDEDIDENKIIIPPPDIRNRMDYPPNVRNRKFYGPPKNETHFNIDCSGSDCLIPFPSPPIPNNKISNETKCTPGVDCPCTPGVDCPCTKGKSIEL